MQPEELGTVDMGTPLSVENSGGGTPSDRAAMLREINEPGGGELQDKVRYSGCGRSYGLGITGNCRGVRGRDAKGPQPILSPP